MSRHTKVIAALLSFSAMVAGAETGNRICLGGNIEQLSSTQRFACQQRAQQVRRAADQAGLSNWHFVVVCDDAGWSDYAAFSTTPAEALQNRATDTNADARTTFVRATGISTPESLSTELVAVVRQAGSQRIQAGE